MANLQAARPWNMLKVEGVEKNGEGGGGGHMNMCMSNEC